MDSVAATNEQLAGEQDHPSRVGVSASGGSKKTAGSSGCTRIPSGGSVRTSRLMGITDGPLDIGRI